MSKQEAGPNVGHIDEADASGRQGVATKPRVPDFHDPDRLAVRDLLWTTALIPAARWVEYRNRVASNGQITARKVVGKVLARDPTILQAWHSTTSWFQVTCDNAVADIIDSLECTVAEIIEQFPKSTSGSRRLYSQAVDVATDTCFTIVPALLDEHLQSPGYQGDKSWRTMEEAVVTKATDGDSAAREYVESHAHLPEHPGMPYWNGTEWADYPADLWEPPTYRGQAQVQDGILQDILWDRDEVCRILNEQERTIVEVDEQPTIQWDTDYPF